MLKYCLSCVRDIVLVVAGISMGAGYLFPGIFFAIGAAFVGAMYVAEREAI